jgi:hypothetical protein
MHVLTRIMIAGATGCLALGIAAASASAQDALKLAALELIIRNSQHDIVVIDTNLKIVSDTIAANVGTAFAEDPGKEIAQTIKDGQPRTFVEKGKDYPQGLRQRVFAVKDGAGKIVGAVVVSADLIKR